MSGSWGVGVDCWPGLWSEDGCGLDSGVDYWPGLWSEDGCRLDSGVDCWPGLWSEDGCGLGDQAGDGGGGAGVVSGLGGRLSAPSDRTQRLPGGPGDTSLPPGEGATTPLGRGQTEHRSTTRGVQNTAPLQPGGAALDTSPVDEQQQGLVRAGDRFGRRPPGREGR